VQYDAIAERPRQSSPLGRKGRSFLPCSQPGPVSGRQFIDWHLCPDGLAQTISRGPAGQGPPGRRDTRLGKAQHKVRASFNPALMFIKANYSCMPLFGSMFVRNVKFAQESALIICGRRDFSTNALQATAERLQRARWNDSRDKLILDTSQADPDLVAYAN
jgi:hypothetical protein